MGLIAHRARKGFAFALLAALAAAAPAQGAVYTILDLGTLGGTLSETQGYNVLNASGQVVGDSSTSNNGARHGFRSPANGTLSAASDLGARGIFGSGASSINASGQVVGNAATDRGDPGNAYRTTANGGIDAASDLRTLGGRTSIAYGINDSGQAVGSSLMIDTATHAFRTTPNGSITPSSDLGTLGGSNSTAYGINASGQAVGIAFTTGNTAAHAFRRRQWPNRIRARRGRVRPGHHRRLGQHRLRHQRVRSGSGEGTDLST